MRRFSFALLLLCTALAAPAGATSMSPTDINHPAFKDLPAPTGTAAAQAAQISAAGCNPKVWSAMVKQAQEAAKKEVSLATALANQIPSDQDCAKAIKRNEHVMGVVSHAEGMRASLMQQAEALAAFTGISTGTMMNIVSKHVPLDILDVDKTLVEPLCMKAGDAQQQLVGGIGGALGDGAFNAPFLSEAEYKALVQPIQPKQPPPSPRASQGTPRANPSPAANLQRNAPSGNAPALDRAPQSPVPQAGNPAAAPAPVPAPKAPPSIYD